MIIINYYNYTPGTGCEPKDVKEPPVFPPSPTALWVPELKLSNQEKLQLTNGEKLNDKHMNGTALVLSKQFPYLLADCCGRLLMGCCKSVDTPLLQLLFEISLAMSFYCTHSALANFRRYTYVSLFYQSEMYDSTALISLGALGTK